MQLRSLFSDIDQKKNFQVLQYPYPLVQKTQQILLKSDRHIQNLHFYITSQMRREKLWDEGQWQETDFVNVNFGYNNTGC